MFRKINHKMSVVIPKISYVKLVSPLKIPKKEKINSIKIFYEQRVRNYMGRSQRPSFKRVKRAELQHLD